MADERHIHALPNGYRLHWYEIDAVLGQGGFGITYLAHDVNLNQRCAIKEYLPTDLAIRTATSTVEPVSGKQEESYSWGLNRFIKEAQTLARFKHPNIVAVNAVFQENNTAYLVMEYVDGEVFEDVLRRRRLRSEEDLLAVLFPILDGIEEIHKAGIIHRDIKPDNIYLRRDGTPVLLDFGSAGDRGEELTALVSPGYAPYEQYDTSDGTDKQGPWTDIYALGATFYRAVTGNGPTDAMSRVHDVLDGSEGFRTATQIARGWYSDQFLSGIDAALAFRPADRPQSVEEWRSLLPPPPGTETDEDDSGLDLLLMPGDDAETEWATDTMMDLVLEAEDEVAEEEEEETVVLNQPLVDVGSAAEKDESGEAVMSIGSDEETVILDVSPIAEQPDATSAEAVDSPGTATPPFEGSDEETVILDASPVASESPSEGADAPDAPKPPFEGSDEETVVLDAPLVDEPKSPVDQDAETVILDAPLTPEPAAPAKSGLSIGDDDATVIFDAEPDAADEPTVVNLNVAADESSADAERVPFQTIITEVEEVEKARSTEVESTTEASAEKRWRPARGPLLKIIGGAVAAALIAAVWLYLYSPGQRGGPTRQLSEEQIAEREAQRLQAEAARKSAEEEQQRQAAEAERLAEEAAAQKAAEEAAAKQKAEEEAARLAAEAEAKRLADEAAAKLAEEEAARLAAEAEAKRLADEAAAQLAAEEAKRQAEAEAARLAAEAEAKRLAEEEAARLAEEEAARLAEEEAARLAAEAEAQRLADEEAEKLAAEEAQRIAEEAEAERLAEEQSGVTADDKAQTIASLLQLIEADVAALRLTSPEGNNALEKVRALNELDPTNAAIGPSYESIVAKYIELADKASGAGDIQKAESYLDRAETVFADSAQLAEARAALEEQKQALVAPSDTVVETDPVVTPEVTSPVDVCAPRLLDPRPNAFPGVISTAYQHPSFRNAPAPKISWARYRYSAVINNKATEQSVSRYDIVDADGVSVRVQKRHELNFDNGSGTASFHENSNGQHVQVMGGLISPIDDIRSVRETTVTKSGVTETKKTDTKTRISITRLYEVSGQLFPLQVGNTFSYKGDSRVVANDETQDVKHQGLPHTYVVSGVVPGSQINSQLSCDVYVLDYVFEKTNYRNTGKLYFAPEIGLIAKQVGDAVTTLSDGRKINRHYERKLLNFK